MRRYEESKCNLENESSIDLNWFVMLSALGRGGSSVSRTTTFRNRSILEKHRELHTADGLSIVSFQCKSQQGLKLLLYKELLLLFSRSVMGPSV